MKRFKVGAAVVALVASTVISVVGVSTPAQAASNCRVSPYSASFSRDLSVGSGVALLPSSTTVYTTTSQCSDIQIKSTNSVALLACVIFTSHTSSCNYTTYVPYTGGWVNIATDVLDGTKFRVQVTLYPECGNVGQVCGGTAAGVLDF
ncbi:hypothetical protein [Catellatospora tritici]|uniref:hypothetical protein n=1 Tax=Catellatospora tritici TaxID=2851566 RepID=UPI001C2DEE4A|nr:hypothetical protein [Catellatospora tritici]MBV1855765.1 hypothetical protein [Catellatospora tritici]